jgi:2-polyprenyl-3-methyl-5-hydroxy-6-metoxy-1,4-benzoquinol methylase
MKKNLDQFLFKDQRFKREYSESDIKNYDETANRIRRFPHAQKVAFKFFNNYAKNNYKFVETYCLCKKKNNEKIISNTDRNLINFVTVICLECGLIRAKYYPQRRDVIDFYQNHYRNIYSRNLLDPEVLFFDQYNKSFDQYNLILKYKIKDLKFLKIIDVGGGVGGILKHFEHNNNILYLADFYDPYLNYSKEKKINIIKGGLNEVRFKPDIIVLSHVVEHWDDFENEIQNLINIQKPNETLNYIEFPAVDSLKLGRREGDIIGDIKFPHFYYFASYVWENIMNRNGFKKIYIDSEMKSIFIYTGEKKPLINYFNKVYADLSIAEKVRKKHIFQNFIKYLMPNIFLKIIRKIRNKKINY